MKIVKAGENCASIEKVSRAAFLIDAENYFRAFRSALLNAKRQILITGWDVDSRVKLVRGKEEDQGRATFSELVDGAVKERRDLEAFVLDRKSVV